MAEQNDPAKLTFPGYNVSFAERQAYYKRQAEARKTAEPIQIAPEFAQKSHAERMAALKVKSATDEKIRQEVSELAGVEKPNGLRVYRDQLAESMRLAHPADKERYRSRLRLAEAELKRQDEVEAEAKRQSEFQSSDLAKNVQTFMETLGSAPQIWPSVPAAEIDKLRAIGESKEFRSPTHYNESFYKQLQVIERIQAESDDATANQAIDQTAATLAQQHLALSRAADSRERLQAVQERLGGGDDAGKS